jgi:steroid delta-isomerase-like uncharacterized protein
MFLKFGSPMTYKKPIYLCLVSLLVLAHDFSFAQPSNERNKELLAIWIKHIDNHDTVALAKLYADSALIESPNWDGTKRGPSAIREIFSRYFSTSPDLTHRITNIFMSENTIIIEYTFSGTMLDPEKGSPAYMRGKKYALKACSRMNIQQGKIAAQSFYFDQVAFLRQVGFFEHQ